MKKIDLKGLIKVPVNFIVTMCRKIDIKRISLKDKNGKKKLMFTLLLVIVGVLLLARLGGNIGKTLFKKKGEAAKKTAGMLFEDEALPVKAFKIKKMDFRDTLPCIGNVKGFKEVDLKFQVSGIIESFNFEEGEKIQEGDIIASLMQRDALLKLKYSELELAKNQKLFDLGAISQTKLDQSKLEYESAKSELDKTNIYAVSNGFLGTRLIDPGSYVSPNDSVGTFVAIDKVYAEFSIIEKDVPKLEIGQKAEVFVDSFPDRSFSGTVDRITPIIEGKSRTQNIKIELDNKDQIMKPGMFIRGMIATYEKKDALVIPSSGLKKKETDYYVYVINKEGEPGQQGAETKSADGKPEKKSWWPFGKKKVAGPKEESKEKTPEFGTIEIRKINVGYMTQDLAEVDDGLKEDELIVIEALEDFKDKARVEIGEVQEGIV